MNETQQYTQNSTPQPPKKGSLWAVIVVAVMFSLAAGATIFFWQNSIVVDLQAQISDLEEDIEREEKERLALEEKYCNGFWEDGQCNAPDCSDSDEQAGSTAIYVSGTVTYTDEKGRVTSVTDECLGNDGQLLENSCSNGARSKELYKCSGGCEDGACKVVEVRQPIVSGGITFIPVDKEKDWIRGNVDAKVSIIEFSDLECPYCQRFHTTMQTVLSEYDGQVNWVYRHFPLTALHPKAQKYAEGAECVGEAGGNDAFWEYVDTVFATEPALTELVNIATQIGLDGSTFEDCLNSGKFAIKVSAQAKDAQNAGGRGTPYSLIVSEGQTTPINGALPFDNVKSQLDQVVR